MCGRAYLLSSILSYRIVPRANSQESIISTTGVFGSVRRVFSTWVPSLVGSSVSVISTLSSLSSIFVRYLYVDDLLLPGHCSVFLFLLDSLSVFLAYSIKIKSRSLIIISAWRWSGGAIVLGKLLAPESGW